ncbi:saccharopine dehydrogenase related protein [Lacticaseibacillus brantae DSM 23927]|uniref:Saccharopine dehydrogenase related protein n=2 Tax=Lacticaseibacillus brantae TaxID=943673 RepID=A0A0R2AYH3_9LACO|nr:saccharopine dehydrogenase related protein [Lacticaseibacillus brantae DSM 23927]
MMKNVLILGASGQIAQMVTDELKDKVNLTLFVRSPQKLIGSKEPATIVQGDALNVDELTAAMKGQDLVYSNLGPDRMAEMAKVVTQAMNNAGVKRLIWVATAGIYGEESTDEGLARATQIFGAYDDPSSYFGDERVGADYIDQAADINATIIRPNALTNADVLENVVVDGRNDRIRPSAQPISRKTVAHFISQLILDDTQYQNDSIAISQG